MTKLSYSQSYDLFLLIRKTIFSKNILSHHNSRISTVQYETRYKATMPFKMEEIDSYLRQSKSNHSGKIYVYWYNHEIKFNIMKNIRDMK